MSADHEIVAEVEGFEELSTPGAPNLPIMIVLPAYDHQWGRALAVRVESAPDVMRPGKMLMCIEEGPPSRGELFMVAWLELRPGRIWRIRREFSMADNRRYYLGKREELMRWAERYMSEAFLQLSMHPGV